MMEKRRIKGVMLAGYFAIFYSLYLFLVTSVFILVFSWNLFMSFSRPSNGMHIDLANFLGALIAFLIALGIGYTGFSILKLKQRGHRIFLILLSLQGVFYWGQSLYVYYFYGIKSVSRDALNKMSLYAFLRKVNFPLEIISDTFTELLFKTGFNAAQSHRYGFYVLNFMIVGILLLAYFYFTRPKVKEQFK